LSTSFFFRISELDDECEAAARLNVVDSNTGSAEPTTRRSDVSYRFVAGYADQ
jgi:hypothetical protein